MSVQGGVGPVRGEPPPPDLRQGTNGLRAQGRLEFSLDPNFLDNGEFKPFFRFCFEFNREGTKRFLERDTALALLPLCGEDRSRHTQLFLEFLGTKPEDFKLNRDQWCSFLDFSLAVGEPPEFAGWDAEGRPGRSYWVGRGVAARRSSRCEGRVIFLCAGI